MSDDIHLSEIFNYKRDRTYPLSWDFECRTSLIYDADLIKRLNGKRKRPDFYVSEVWRDKENGSLGRACGPAIQLMNPINGIAVIQRYYAGGKLHRQFGPAIIERDTYTGEITKQEFYRKGRLVIPSYGPEKWSPL